MLSKKYWPHYKNMQTHFLMCKEKMRKKIKTKKKTKLIVLVVKITQLMLIQEK